MEASLARAETSMIDKSVRKAKPMDQLEFLMGHAKNVNDLEPHDNLGDKTRNLITDGPDHSAGKTR